MNLLSIAPLLDSRGIVRYFIGAQVDVSGLVKDCTELASLQRLLVLEQQRRNGVSERDSPFPKKDEFQELSEMLNTSELETIRHWGGRMHHEQCDNDDDDESRRASNRPRLLLKEPSTGEIDAPGTAMLSSTGRLPGVYQNVDSSFFFLVIALY